MYSIGMRWCAAVHSVPGANMKSPSPPKDTVSRPCCLLASAAPREAGRLYPTPAPPDTPFQRYGLSKFHSRCGQLNRIEVPTIDQSSSLIWAYTSAHMRAVVIGLASQPSVASDFVCSTIALWAAASFLPRVSEADLRDGSMKRFTASIISAMLASP